MKKAFTMMELVFILVVIGIIAVVVIPNTKTNPLQEAAVQLASHIRYAQHLAMIDDKYDPNRLDAAGNVIWYKDRWQLVFLNDPNTNNQWAYTIFADTQGGAVPEEAEIARNPENFDQRMTGGYSGLNPLNINDPSFVGMKKLNLGMSYSVTSVNLTGGCANQRISFDHLGRPFTGDQSTMTSPYNVSNPYSTVKQRLIMTDCNIVLKDANDNNVTLTVAPETGYVKINF